MLNKVYEFTSGILGSLGIVLSVQDVNEVLNIILLILSIINILIVAISKIVNLYKSNLLTPEEVVDIITDTVEDIEKVVKENEEN